MAGYIPPRYRYSMHDHGTVAARVFLVITNPVGSGKIVEMMVNRVATAAAGAVSGQPPLIMSRASAVSGGTLINNSTAIMEFDTSLPVSGVEIRTDNPTATAGASCATFHSVESTGAGQGAVIESDETGMLLREGESMMYATASGDVDQHFVIEIEWAER